MKVATASIFTAAALGSTVGLSGSSTASHPVSPSAAHVQQVQQAADAAPASRK
jgi:hypothetical protein